MTSAPETRMEVAFLVDEFPRESQPFIVNQVTGLCERGHDVAVYATGEPDPNDRDTKIPDDVRRRVHYTPIPYRKIDRLRSAGPLLVRALRRDPLVTARVLDPFQFGRDALSLRPLYRLAPLAGREFDVLHCHFAPKGQIGSVLTQAGFEGKLVVSMHGHGVRQAQQNPEQYSRLLNTCDCFLANSRHTYDQLRDLGVSESKLHVHANGIDVDRFPFKWSDGGHQTADTVRIVTVARLEDVKGVRYGIEGIAGLDTDADVEYHVVGDGSRRGELVELAADLGVGDRVEFHGHVPRERVLTELSASDLFLLPSLNEAFGMVLLEAQAVGLPVVATDVGGVPEVVDDGESAILVPPRDADAIADALRQLVDDPRRWPGMGACGREYVSERFDIADLNRELVETYRS